MAASVGFFNPSISNTANVVLVGSILTTTCLLQLMVQKNFEAKANEQESDSLRLRTILILSGSSGVAGLLAGGDLKKSVALAAAALVILAVVDFASQHSEDKTPHDPKGKNPDSPTTSPRETPPVTPVKGKSPKKTVLSTLAAIPASGSPEKVVRSMPPPPSKSSGSPLKTVPVGSGNGSAPLRKKWPDPTKPVPPRVAPPQGSPIHTMPSPRVVTSLANDPASEPTSETLGQVEGRQSPTPPPVPGFDEDKGETELMVHRLQGVLTSNLGEDWDAIGAVEEGVEEPVAVVAPPSPPKKSKLEHITAEIANTEQTFFDAMVGYTVQLSNLQGSGFITVAEYHYIIEGVTEILDNSPLFMDYIRKQGAHAVYSNTEIMDSYFSALIILMEHTKPATKILLDAITAIEDPATQKIYDKLWETATFPFQRATRHPLLLKQLVEEDVSFEPLRKKFADWVDRSNNRRLLEEFDSLTPAIQELSESEKNKLQIVDNFGTITYNIISRKKPLFNRKSTDPTEPGAVVEDSVKVLEHTLDFLIRLAKIATSQEPHPDLEKITKQQVTWCFTTLEQHDWYTKAAAGAKTRRLSVVANQVAPKANELRAILGLEGKAN